MARDAGSMSNNVRCRCMQLLCCGLNAKWMSSHCMMRFEVVHVTCGVCSTRANRAMSASRCLRKAHTHTLTHTSADVRRLPRVCNHRVVQKRRVSIRENGANGVVGIILSDGRKLVAARLMFARPFNAVQRAHRCTAFIFCRCRTAQQASVDSQLTHSADCPRDALRIAH